MEVFVLHSDLEKHALTPIVTSTAETAALEALKLCNSKGAPWSTLRVVHSNHEDIEPTVEGITEFLNKEYSVYLFDDNDEEVIRIARTTLLK